MLLLYEPQGCSHCRLDLQCHLAIRHARVCEEDPTNGGTVTSLCKDTLCKDMLGARTAQSRSNHCMLTALEPLSKDNLM